MKKLYVLVFLIICLFATFLSTDVRAEEKQQYEYDLIVDTLITTLNPHIKK